LVVDVEDVEEEAPKKIGQGFPPIFWFLNFYWDSKI